MYDNHEFIQIARIIIEHEEYIKRKDFPHHGEETVYQHSMKVAYVGYIIAKKLGANYNDVVIAGLLHDFYTTPWQDNTEKVTFFKQHGFVHASEALDNSKLYFEEYLNKYIEDAIKKHMFPLNIIPPKYLTSWIVTLSDKYVSLEVLKDVKNLPKYIGIKKKK